MNSKVTEQDVQWCLHIVSPAIPSSVAASHLEFVVCHVAYGRFYTCSPCHLAKRGGKMGAIESPRINARCSVK
eukprot:1189692-Amphidinium_carterae.1